MIARNHKTPVLLLVTVLMLACAVPTLAPASAPVPTFDPNSINTVIAQTAGAAATQTALVVTPTFTATATQEPTDTPTETPTATFLFILPTMTVPPTMIPPGSSDLDFDCQVLSQTPANNTTIQRSSVFEVHWKVANIGKLSWDSNNVDYRYASGEKMHRVSAYDFEQFVPPGGIGEFIVAMQAPLEPGSYTTTWRVSSGRTRFCSMSITIIVN